MPGMDPPHRSMVVMLPHLAWWVEPTWQSMDSQSRSTKLWQKCR